MLQDWSCHREFFDEQFNRHGSISGILKEADGIMVARGELGVEIPLPTRTGATDVANAILDGTGCVMLSGESAVGEYPVESERMLKAISADIEPNCSRYAKSREPNLTTSDVPIVFQDVIALSVASALNSIPPLAISTPTRSGATASRISRFRLPVWIIAVNFRNKTCQEVLFFMGYRLSTNRTIPKIGKPGSVVGLNVRNIGGGLLNFTEGPSAKYPDRNNRMTIFDLNGG